MVGMELRVGVGDLGVVYEGGSGVEYIDISVSQLILS